MQQTLGVGLIGAGRIGRVHAENIAFRVPQARLVAVADINVEAAQSCAQECGAASYTDAYQELLERSDVEAVAICTSSTTHTEIIEAAAAAGKHIFCEKPIDITLERIDRALEAVEQAGVLLQVGFQRRFDASFQRVRSAIKQGEIGVPHTLHIVSRDPAPPPIAFIKKSGGLFLDMTIHDFDVVNYLLRSPVKSVFTTAAVRTDPAIGQAGDVDTAVVVLRFEGGAIATIENARRTTYGYDQRLEVFGGQGSICVENAYPHTAVVFGAAGVRRGTPYHFFIERYSEAYVKELRAFAEAVLTGGPSPVSGREARVPVVVGLAAQRSLDTGLPVRIRDIEPS